MTKRISLIALCFALVAALVFTGCAPTARRPYNNNGDRLSYTDMGTNRGYDTGGNITNTGNNTGAGANPGTTGYSTGTTIGTGYGYGYGTGYENGYGTYPNGPTRTGYGTIGTGYGTPTGYGTTGTGLGTTVGTSVSDRIATAVRQIQGVQAATTVVNGNTAYVGVTLTGTTANTADMRNRVSQVAKAIGNGVTTVYVSTDTSFMNRLRTVDQGIRSGKAINGFTNELKNMVNGITPAR